MTRSQIWFDLPDLQNLLAAANATTDRGEPWTERQCFVWMQAAGERHDGRQMVHRNKVRATFPEVWERLEMG